VPTRRWLDATRVSTAPGSTASRTHRLAGGGHRQRARGRDAQRVHGLADEDLAQHRPDRRLAVAAARERRAARALERDVAPRPWRSSTSPSSSARPSPSCGEKPPNWWPAYACASGSAPSGTTLPAKMAAPSSPAALVGVQAQFLGQRTVQEQQPRLAHLGRLPRHVQALQFAGVGVVETEGGGGGGGLHGGSLTRFGCPRRPRAASAAAPPRRAQARLSAGVRWPANLAQ
jgi:hypothetical protein